jgi:hypothetical protein
LGLLILVDLALILLYGLPMTRCNI